MKEVRIRRKRGQLERNELSRLAVFVWVWLCGCDCVGEEGSVWVGQP